MALKYDLFYLHASLPHHTGIDTKGMSAQTKTTVQHVHVVRTNIQRPERRSTIRS